MKLKILFLLPPILIVPMITYWSVFMFGYGSLASRLEPYLQVASFGLIPASVWLIRRLHAGLWILCGLLVLTGLFFLPISMLVQYPYYLPARTRESWILVTFWLIPAALLVAALLLNSGLNLYKTGDRSGEVAGTNPSAFSGVARDLTTDEKGNPGSPVQRKHDSWIAAIIFVLSGILLARILYDLYWLTIWDHADDSIGTLNLYMPILWALFSGALIINTLPGKTRLIGLSYALIVPLAMIATYRLADPVDSRKLTEQHAAKVNQAIEAYYTHEGRYPDNLQQLTPWYLLSIPKPITLSGQTWCYDAGKDYYRLGYINRDYWSSPFYGKIYATQGRLPDLPKVCQHELEFFNRNTLNIINKWIVMSESEQ